MPNEKLPEINEHDAEELIHYPQDEEQKERRSRLLPGRWTRRVQKSSPRAGIHRPYQPVNAARQRQGKRRYDEEVSPGTDAPCNI